jgi:DNA-binding NarL/FixJ family response regulator
MTMLREKNLGLVIVDEELADAPGIELVRLVARNHPFVHCVLVSRLPAEEFHELTEGLGVLMQLSSPPQLSEAKAILAQLSAVDATGVASRQAERAK